MEDDETRDRMTEFALGFPSMRGAPGVVPFGPSTEPLGVGAAWHGER